MKRSHVPHFCQFPLATTAVREEAADPELGAVIER